MIISVSEARTYPEFADMSDDELTTLLDAVESLVRKYTNNNFQNRFIRFKASSEGKVLDGTSDFLQVGDTVQISESDVNDGLYVITELEGGTTTVDKDLWTVDNNLVTKVEYPPAVRQGVINLLKWEVSGRDKVGIKQESISRHSVTYYDQDVNNQVMGYPATLLGFLEMYKKARF